MQLILLMYAESDCGERYVRSDNLLQIHVKEFVCACVYIVSQP